MANAEVGSAYVTIMPAMDRGFGKTVEGALSDAGSKGGASFEGGMLGSLKGMAGKLAGILGLATIAKTLYDIGHAAVDAYADFEQLAGGVEVLYGDAAQQVMENANQAFRTAGLSANAYMEQSTSMAAALVNSLGGDTEEAARMADMAITDMADNANRMGTDLSAIQNAYQGFAKQNYTMLDNLKLGYGGTRGEMERLLADAEAISGIHYDIENYDDVVEAIHVIQTEMGVTGATAEEAASTISGSWGMLTASWENLLVSIAGGGEELDAAIRNVVDSLFTWLGNIVPRVGEVIQGMMQAIPGIIADALPDVTAAVMGFIRDTFGSDTADTVLDWVNQVHGIIGRLADKFSEFSDAVAEYVLPAFQGIVDAIAPIVEDAVPKMLSLFETVSGGVIDLATVAMEWVGKAIQFATPAIEGILQTVTSVFDGIRTTIEGVVKFVTSLVKGDFEGMKESVGQIFDGILSTATSIWEGVKSAISTAIEGAKEVVGNAIEAIKGFFSFEFHWPHIPLPHFSITGSANPLDWISGGLPSIGVEWYGTGGIVDGATLIGAGERGKELIWPSYDPYLDMYADAIAKRMGGGGNVYVGATAINDDAMIRSNYEQLVLRSYRRAGRL